MLVALVLPGPPGENMCKSGPGTDVSAFPEVTEEEAFLKCASRQKNKGLGQREETCTCGRAQIAIKKLRFCGQNISSLDSYSSPLQPSKAHCIFFSFE